MESFLKIFTIFVYAVASSDVYSSIYPIDQGMNEQSLRNIQQITYSSMGFEKAGEAYFSPDGDSIIFQAVPSGQKQYQIYTLDLVLADRAPVMVSTGKGACTCANFKPDGTKIIFASSHEDPVLSTPLSAPGYKREGSEYTWDFTSYMNIYEADLDGTNLIPLTSGASYSAECAYSPDGSKIVFASNRDGYMNIYTMNSDGSDVYQVTRTKDCYNGGPFFSPDGKKILFRSDRIKRHYLQIYCINTDGTGLFQITNNAEVNWAPYWHPQGDVIAYTTSLHGHDRYEIYLKNIRTGAEHRLTNSIGFDGIPVFNRQGDKLMWTSKRGSDKTCQIFIAEFDMPEELK